MRIEKINCFNAVVLASGLAAAISLVVAAPSAAGEAYWNSERRAACPPGHRAPVSIGDTTFYLDFRMITHLELGDHPAPKQPCPTTPFDAKYVYFYYGYKELALLYKQHALPLTQLRLEAGDHTRLRHAASFRKFSEIKRAVGEQGFVEDITKSEAAGTYGDVNQRTYLIQHSSATGGGEPVLFVCSGDPHGSPPRRDCETDYLLKPGLIVRYSIRQDGRDQSARHWEIPPSGSIKEPDGLLDVDSKVRMLIRFFTSAP